MCGLVSAHRRPVLKNRMPPALQAIAAQALAASAADGAAAYHLSSSAFACRTPRSWYVLDIEHDSYLRIDGALFDSLLPLMQGCDRLARSRDDVSRPVPESTLELALQLELRGILTTTGAGRPVSASAVGIPVQSLLPKSRVNPTWVTCAGAFFLACIRADRALKNRTLAENVRRLRERKQVRATADFSLVRAAQLVASFDALRPFYPRDYLCLFDSLALIEFLALYRLYPDWVFGVTDDPFQAHCWVQYGDCALNESIEFASAYTPIMAV